MRTTLDIKVNRNTGKVAIDTQDDTGCSWVIHGEGSWKYDREVNGPDWERFALPIPKPARVFKSGDVVDISKGRALRLGSSWYVVKPTSYEYLGSDRDVSGKSYDYLGNLNDLETFELS